MFSWLFNDYDFLLIRQVKYQNCFKKKSGKRKIFWTSYLEVHCLVEKTLPKTRRLDKIHTF